MKTMAVVCDDIIECSENRDEKFCGGPKNYMVSYILTFFACMFYVVLKIIWWFYQRNLPLNDEDEDFSFIPKEELSTTPSNEVNFKSKKVFYISNLLRQAIESSSEGS